MNSLSVRLIEYGVLAAAFIGMAIDLAIGFWGDYGAPWHRRSGADGRSGTDGRWRTDALVVVLVAALGAICAIAFTSTLTDGWRGERLTTTVLLGVLAVTVLGLWLSGRLERRKVERRGDAAADRTERAADRAEVASEDTRRSARKTEVAAETVIERMVEGEVAAQRRDVRADEREDRMDVRGRADTDGGVGNRPD